MVGGPDFETKPFNLATQGHRQPGSSIKPFTLITALEEGISPDTDLRIGAAGPSTSASTARKPSTSTTTRTPTSAPATSSARPPTRTTRSTPQLGLEGLKGKTVEDRTRSIAATIHKAGLRRPDLDQPGDGPRRPRRKASRRSAGPTPTRRSATTATASAAPSRRGPATARSPSPRSPTRTATRSRAATTTRSTTRSSTKRRPKKRRASSKPSSRSGTGTHAQIGAEGQWGKTGTTENNGDAWFCGGDPTKSPPASGSATPTRRRR